VNAVEATLQLPAFDGRLDVLVLNHAVQRWGWLLCAPAPNPRALFRGVASIFSDPATVVVTLGTFCACAVGASMVVVPIAVLFCVDAYVCLSARRRFRSPANG
jgi:hypothetical protein